MLWPGTGRVAGKYLFLRTIPDLGRERNRVLPDDHSWFEIFKMHVMLCFNPDQ
jgi:hypothetical protein